MSVYLTVTFEYASREDAEREGYPGENARSYVCEPVSDTPPVVLSGLVKGGEIQTEDDWWLLWPAPDTHVLTDSSGRFAPCALAAVRDALPVTWYTVAP